MSGQARRVWVALAIVYVVWGSTYLGIKEAVRTIPPFLMAGARFLVAGAVLYAWAIGRGDRDADRIGARQWRAAIVVGGLLLASGNAILAWAEQRGVATGVAALIIGAVPIYMAVISACFREEPVRGRTLAGLAAGFAGTALLIKGGTGSRGGALDVFGVGAIVVASVSWALGSVMSRHVSLPRRPSVATAMEMLGGGALCVLVGVARGELGGLQLSRVSLGSLVGLGYLIVFGSLVAFSAYVWLLKNASTSLVSTYAYVNPVIAVLLGVLVLNERFTAIELVAAVLIVSAVAMIVLDQGRRRRELEEAARVGTAA
jgi:drug/metabolite transporter (DMT)-like permease